MDIALRLAYIFAVAGFGYGDRDPVASDQGGYAEYAVAPIKNLVKVPDAVSLAQAAVATDSIATAYHVVAEGRVKYTCAACIIGLGGLGLNGVAVAARLGAEVYGVVISPSIFEPARAAGAMALATKH
ncbi:hypothetical protein VDGL01_06498 [Verticillium dahliae]